MPIRTTVICTFLFNKNVLHIIFTILLFYHAIVMKQMCSLQ